MKSIILSLLIIICLASASFSRYLKRKNHFLNKGDIQLDGIKLINEENPDNILEIKKVIVSEEKLKDEHKIVLKFEKEDDAKAKIKKWLNENAVKIGTTEETKVKGGFLNIDLPEDKIEDWINFELPFQDILGIEGQESLMTHKNPQLSLDIKIKKNNNIYYLALRFQNKEIKADFKKKLEQMPEFWVEQIKNHYFKPSYSSITSDYEDDVNYIRLTKEAFKEMKRRNIYKSVAEKVAESIKKLMKTSIGGEDFDKKVYNKYLAKYDIPNNFA